MIKFIILTVIAFAAGIMLGTATMQRLRPNVSPEVHPARHPWKAKNILGLIGSLGIKALAGHMDILPFVVLETDKTLVLELPTSGKKVHYVIVPKKNIADCGQISAEDAPYLTDIFLTARHLIEKNGLYHYKISTNGPGYQKVRYLHFHLFGSKR